MFFFRLLYNDKKTHFLCNSFRFIRSCVQIYSKSFQVSSFEIGHFVFNLNCFSYLKFKLILKCSTSEQWVTGMFIKTEINLFSLVCFDYHIASIWWVTWCLPNCLERGIFAELNILSSLYQPKTDIEQYCQRENHV